MSWRLIGWRLALLGSTLELRSCQRRNVQKIDFYFLDLHFQLIEQISFSHRVINEPKISCQDFSQQGIHKQINDSRKHFLHAPLQEHKELLNKNNDKSVGCLLIDCSPSCAFLSADILENPFDSDSGEYQGSNSHSCNWEKTFCFPPGLSERMQKIEFRIRKEKDSYIDVYLYQRKEMLYGAASHTTI